MSGKILEWENPANVAIVFERLSPRDRAIAGAAPEAIRLVKLFSKVMRTLSRPGTPLNMMEAESARKTADSLDGFIVSLGESL